MSATDKITAWVSAVTAKVHWKAAHRSIEKELRDHIEDQCAAFTAAGLNEEEAVLRSLREMGDAEVVGTQLDAAWRPKHSLLLPLCAVGLALAGVAAQYPGGAWWSAPIGPLFVALFACALVFVSSRIEITVLHRAGLVLYGGYILFFFLILCFFSSRVNGRAYFGGTIDLSYLVYLLPLFYVLALCRLRGKGIRGVLTAGLLFAPAAMLGLNVPDLGGTFLTTLLCLGLLTGAILSCQFGGNRKVQLCVVWGGALIVAIALGTPLLLNPYFRTRFALMVDPALDPLGMGYCAIVVRQVLSGVTMLSGSDAEALAMLPAAQSDYLLTAFIGRYGWWVLGIVLILLGALLLLAMRCALRQKSRSGKLIAGAVIGIWALQSIAFISANLGYLFFSSLPLPFFGSSLSILFNAFLLGILLAVLRSGDLLSDCPFPAPKPLLELTRDGALVLRLRD